MRYCENWIFNNKYIPTSAVNTAITALLFFSPTAGINHRPSPLDLGAENTQKVLAFNMEKSLVGGDPHC